MISFSMAANRIHRRWRARLMGIVIVGCCLGFAQLEAQVGIPLWARKVVWYEIFPERFRNGDPSNDPTPNDMIGSWPHEIAKGWCISNWTGDWYAQQPWEKNDGKPFYFHVQQRRYGGDIQGIIDKLDYLRKLGIGALYLTPMFESPSLHKYDASMYHHIDNNFGPDPEGDKKIWESENPADPSTWKWTSADKLFLKLVHEAHSRNIKIVIDGVFNHVGQTFWAFEDVEKNQQLSKFKSWFTVKAWDDPSTPQNEFKYDGWNGVLELPEWRKNDSGLVSGPREHIDAIVKRWMDPNGDGNPDDGIDGWRLDAAEKVNIKFWQEFRRWVRAINPNAYLVGEVWWEDWSNDKMYDPSPWLKGDAFDAVMNYRWARESFRYFAGATTGISVAEFVRRLEALRDEESLETNQALLNLLDSHDTDRLGSHIVNTDLPYDKNVGLSDNRNYAIRRPNADELRILKLMVLFQMTYVGAPMVYYGDEAGMWGGDDPDCRKPMLWGDLKYDDERSHPFGGSRPEDKNEFNRDLHDWYANLIAIRNAHPSLQMGSFTLLEADSTANILSFVRTSAEEQVIVILNNNILAREMSIRLPQEIASKKWRDVPLSGQSANVENGVLHCSVEGKTGLILESVR